jgi:cell division protein FtsB
MVSPRKMIWAAVAVSLVLAVSSLADPGGFRRTWRLQDDVRALQARTERLGSENARLRREVTALKEDPQAIERAVREELGHVRPGELIITLESR